MKKIHALIGGIIFVAAGAASPYLSVMSLQSDIESKDGESLADKVDFPSVRESLKDQFNLALAKTTMEVSEEGDPWSSAGSVLGAAFASTLVNGMVDTLVTPSGLIELMSSGEVGGGGDGQADAENDQKLAFSNAVLAYEGINRFSATLQYDDGDELKLILNGKVSAGS